MAMLRKEESPFYGYNRRTRRRLEKLWRQGRIEVVEDDGWDEWEVIEEEVDCPEPQFGWFGVDGIEDFSGTMSDLEERDSA